MTRVKGYCPSCGNETLFLGEGGYVTCSLIGCENPTAASDILFDGKETCHLATFTDDAWSIKHPLIERIDNALLSCDLFTEMGGRSGPPVKPGTYRVTPDGEGGWNFEGVVT